MQTIWEKTFTDIDIEVLVLHHFSQGSSRNVKIEQTPGTRFFYDFFANNWTRIFFLFPPLLSCFFMEIDFTPPDFVLNLVNAADF